MSFRAHEGTLYQWDHVVAPRDIAYPPIQMPEAPRFGAGSDTGALADLAGFVFSLLWLTFVVAGIALVLFLFIAGVR